MYFDDSSGEIKLTDVTHGDLETKSILKPRKVRAPLQEVDLGNQITVEYDVIRKKRVSFAGVNKIKEFNSEAKSFCIYNTPVYEEKVSTSSDSSAFSSSVSGNTHDITIFLEDTMDLTDLSISQPSCSMDITSAKPQGCIFDTFAYKSQDTDAVLLGCPISNKHPALHSENDNLYLNPDPLQALNRHKMEKPANSPPVTDPTKMLIKELLEDSMVDLHVDKSLKGSFLFMKNKFPLIPNTNTHNLGESKCLSTDCRKTPGMELTEAQPKLTSTYECTQTPAPAMIDPYQDPHHKIISQNLPNLFGAQQVYLEKSNTDKLFQSNASQMDFTEADPKVIFPLNSVGCEISQELVDSSQPSHRIMSQNPFSVFDSHCAVEEELMPVKVFQSNISQMEFTEAISPRKAEAFMNPVIQCQNMESGSMETLSMSQMEFTEALPPKNTCRVLQHIGVENQNSEIKLSANAHKMPLLEFPEALPSRSSKCATDIMEKKNVEFMAALPCQKTPENSGDLAAHIHKSSIPFVDIFGNGNYDRQTPESQVLLKENNKMAKATERLNGHLNPPNIFSKLEDLNESNLMDVTEIYHKQADDLKDGNFLEPSKSKPLSFSQFQNNKLIFKCNTSQMEFTKALPETHTTRNIFLINVNEFEEDIKENLCGNRNVHITKRNSTMPPSNNNTINTSHMEFTEALPQWRPEPNRLVNSNEFEEDIEENLCGDRNVHITKRKSIVAPSSNYTMDTSHMEFTEALPQWKPVSNELVKSDEFEKEMKENICSDRNVLITKRKSIMAPSGNYTLDTSHMEFTEALPQWKPVSNELVNSDEFEEDMKENICSDRNVLITKRKSIMAPSSNDTINTSHMEFTEALPQWKPVSNELVNSDEFEKEMKENICSDRNVLITKRKSIMALSGNYTLDTSHMEFTEALPQWKPVSNELVKSNEFEEEMKENICSDRNVLITKRKSIMAPSGNYTLDTSHMEFTEALPQWKPLSNELLKSNEFEEEMKENICSNRNVLITKRKSIMAPSGNYTLDTSHMEFTEALPQWKPLSNELVKSDEFEEEMKENICSDRNVLITKRKSIMAPSGNYTLETSLMELTEDLPQWKPLSNELVKSDEFEEEMKENICSDRNVLITKRKSIMAPCGNYTNDTSHMELTEALPQWKPQSNQLSNTQEFKEEMKENICSDRNVLKTNRKSIMAPSGNYKLDTTHMEFAEALPPRKLLSNELVNSIEFEEELIENICSDRNVHITKRNTIIPPTSNYTIDTSHMEFTEALSQWKPEANQLAVSQEFEEGIKDYLCGDRNIHITNRKSIMAPSGNYKVDTSHMEITEASPQWKPQSHKLSNTQELKEEMKENMSGDKNGDKTKRKSIMASSGYCTDNTSHMEFTEALPQWKPQSNQLVNSNEFKEDIKENLCGDRNVHITKRKSIMASSGYCTDNTSHMEFTEALPQWKPQSNQLINSNEFEEEMKENICSDKNVQLTKRKSIMARSGKYTHDISLMEFTEALPQGKTQSNKLAISQEFEDEINENLCGDGNVHITKGVSIMASSGNCTDNTSHMEFTEALPQSKHQSNQLVKCNEFEEEIKENICSDRNVHITKRKSIMAPSGNYTNDMSNMEFTEALPLWKPVSNQLSNTQEPEDEIERNLCDDKSVYINKIKGTKPSSGNYTIDTSHMEFTESLPLWKPESNQLAISQEFEEGIKDYLCGDRNIHITNRKSIMAPSGNYKVDTSHMEITEASPQWKPQSHKLSNTQELKEEMKENMSGDKNGDKTKRKSIMASSGYCTDNTSHMEFTEALPQWKPQSNQLVNSNEFKEDIKENLCGDRNVHITKRKSIMASSGNCTDNTSHMEFTEALPQSKHQSNQLVKCNEFEEEIKENICSDRNVHITKRKSIMAPSGNYTNDMSNMEFTEALPLWKPESNQLSNTQEPEDEIERNLCDDKSVYINKIKGTKPSSGNYTINTSHMEFTESLPLWKPESNQLAIIQEFEVEIKDKLCGDRNVHMRKSIIASSRNCETSEAIPIEKLCSKAIANIPKNSLKASKIISEVEVNDENIPKVHNQKVASPHKHLEHNADAGSQNNNYKSGTLVAGNNSDRNVSETCKVEFREDMQDPDEVQVGPTDKINEHSISSSEIIVNQSNSLNSIMENIRPEKVDQELINNLVIWSPEINGTIEPSRSLLNEMDVSNLSDKSNAASKTEMDLSLHSQLKCPNQINQISPGISFSKKADKKQEFTLAPVNNRGEAATEISHVSPYCLFSEDANRIDVEQSDLATIDDNDNNELIKNSVIFGTINLTNVPQSHSEYNTTQIAYNISDPSLAGNNLPIMEQELSRTCLFQESNIHDYNPGLKEANDNFEKVRIIDNINYASRSQKKNLVHFNTPPVPSIIKKRKTLRPDQSRQLTQSFRSNLSQCFNWESDMNDVLSKPQKKGLFDEERRSIFNSDKGKEEWERLMKNDSFMKVNGFEFVSTTKWKYKFKWPVELFLEIPEAEIDQSSRKKCITLVSKISHSDQLSLFVDTRMKKKLGVILSEKWLNLHCKTIKDVLVTIKFVEQEYNNLESLISSLRYFYREFPFDFKNERVIFTIVNLRKKYCFEVRIDVSYGLVKGKNIDVINHVGHISKTKIRRCFDELQPNTEQFFLFWQTLKKADMLSLA